MLFEIIYKSPDNEAGHFEPAHLIDSIQQQHHQIHDHSDTSIDDDQQKLLDIEQNIANIEKNLKRNNNFLSIFKTFFFPSLEYFDE